jgi:hypothetical protein
MKTLGPLLLVMLCAACASIEKQEAVYEADKEDRMAAIAETRAYVDAANLETVNSVRYRQPLKWDYLNNQYVTLDTTTGKHLIEVRRYCPDLSNNDRNAVYADSRSGIVSNQAGELKVLRDTIRGCQISAIYKLPDVPPEPGTEQ